MLLLLAGKVRSKRFGILRTEHGKMPLPPQHYLRQPLLAQRRSRRTRAVLLRWSVPCVSQVPGTKRKGLLSRLLWRLLLRRR